MCRYVCIWRQDVNLKCHSSGAIHLFLDLSLAWKSFVRVGWLASQLDRVPRCLPLATPIEQGLSANYYAIYFYVGSETGFTSSCYPD